MIRTRIRSLPVWAGAAASALIFLGGFSPAWAQVPTTSTPLPRAALFGWDSVNQTWVAIGVDDTGQVDTTAGAGGGDASAANQTTMITALEIIDNIVSGSEAQVDVVAPLPAGTNNIGDVDVASMPADATELPAASSLADTESNPSVPRVGAMMMCWNGATWDRCTTSTPDVCDSDDKVYSPFDIVTATTTEIIDESASNNIYVCSFQLWTSAAVNVAIVEDADDACPTPSGALFGGVTAAEGMVMIANQGIVMGNGGGTIMKTSATDLNVCLITSTTAQVSGVVSYVAAP